MSAGKHSLYYRSEGQSQGSYRQVDILTHGWTIKLWAPRAQTWKGTLPQQHSKVIIFRRCLLNALLYKYFRNTVLYKILHKAILKRCSAMWHVQTASLIVFYFFFIFIFFKSVGCDIFCQIQVTQTIVHMHTPHPLSFHPIPTAEVLKYKIGNWKIQNTVQKNHKQKTSSGTTDEVFTSSRNCHHVFLLVEPFMKI